jgi:hypothetical protein
MSRRILQVILAIIGLILTVTSLWGMIAGVADEFYAVSISNEIQGNIILDSNLRFYYGLTLGLGLIIFWIIPSIEKRKTIFRLISLMIFLGAIGRVISLMTAGIPSIPFIIFTLLELFFPLLIFWQNKITESYP